MVDNAQAVQDGSDDASDTTRFDGLVEQVRQDVAFGSVDDARAELLTRLKDGGFDADVDDALVDSLLARVTEER